MSFKYCEMGEGMYNCGISELPETYFESKRLRFRPIDKKDIDDVYEYGKDEDTCRFLNWGPYKYKEEAERFVEKKIEEDDLQWVIVLKEIDKVIGAIRVYNVDEKNKAADVSYIQNRQYCSLGYMTESLKALIEYARKVLRLETIYTYYIEENRASENVMKRCGMKKDNIFEEKIIIKGREYIEKRYYSREGIVI